jgi:hypothetical protein
MASGMALVCLCGAAMGLIACVAAAWLPRALSAAAPGNQGAAAFDATR